MPSALNQEQLDRIELNIRRRLRDEPEMHQRTELELRRGLKSIGEYRRVLRDRTAGGIAANVAKGAVKSVPELVELAAKAVELPRRGLKAGLELLRQPRENARALPYAGEVIEAMANVGPGLVEKGLGAPARELRRMAPNRGTTSELVGSILGAGGLMGGARAAAGKAILPEVLGTAGSAAGGAIGNEAGGSGGALVGALSGGIAGPALRPRTVGNLARTLIAGPRQSRQRAMANLDQNMEQNIAPNLAQVAESGPQRTVATLLQRLPGSNALVTKQAVKLADDAERRMRQIVNSPIRDRGAAGAVIERGYDKYMDRMKAAFDKRFGVMDSEVEQLLRAKLPNASVPLDKTKQAMEQLISAWHLKPELMEAWAASPKLLKMAQTLAVESGVPWPVFRAMRTQLGSQLRKKQFVMDVPKGEIKKLYGAMADDLTDVLGRLGGRNLVGKYSSLVADYRKHGRLVDDVIHKIGGKKHDQIWKSILGRRDPDGGAVKAILEPLTAPERELVVGAFFNRMGIPPGSVGARWDFSTFMTRWTNTIEDNAALRKVLLSTPRLQRYGKDLTAFKNIMKQYDSRARIFRNTSGTAPAGIGMAALFFGVSGLASGSPLLLSTAATAGGISIATRLMASPTFLRLALKTHRVPPAALPGHFLRMDAALRSAEPGRDEEIDDLMQRIRQYMQAAQQGQPQ